MLVALIVFLLDTSDCNLLKTIDMSQACYLGLSLSLILGLKAHYQVRKLLI